jgi:hypothetical protein
LDEETITTTPEPLPELPPSEPGVEPPSEPESADPLTVVSVDDLIDRLVQSSQEEEEPEEAPPSDADELPEEDDQTGDIFMEVDTAPMEIKGMDKLLTYAETVQQTLDHPALTTSFQDYTVTEGLLLLILLAAFATACIKILKGGFQWLRW